MSNSEKLEQLEKLVGQLANQINVLTASGQRFLQENITDDEAVAWAPDSGDTAWLMTSTALVLFMTMPGLCLYYCGMVRTKNVLATVMQSFTIFCLITVLWLMWGYSLSFGPADADSNTGNPIFGDGSRCWFRGMSLETSHQLAGTIPEAIFCMYQLTFATITAALITGSFADRMKYESMILFTILWHTCVYCPTAHAVWHPDGFLFKAGVLDFAGGDVVHIASGISGLVTTIIIGKRKGFGSENFEPHNILMTFMGMSMLWVGWLGFNGGSAVASNARASYAIMNTIISTSTASFSWMLIEWYVRKQPSVVGMINGAIAGLVCVTPACGFVDPTGSFIIGLLGGPFCYFGSQVKHHMGYDDALDAFGVHAVGGIFGGIATGFFANPDNGGFYGVYYAGLEVGGKQLGNQIYGIVVTCGWAAFMTAIICILIEKTIGLRVSAEAEEMGLDSSIHGESIVPATSPMLQEKVDEADISTAPVVLKEPKKTPFGWISARRISP